MTVLENAEPEFIHNLILGGINLDNATMEGFTALHFASGYGWTSLTEKLLQQGANVNLKDHHYGATALHFAVRNNNIAEIKLLLQYGADTQILDHKGETPLDNANNIFIKELLVQHDEDTMEKFFAIVFN